MKTQVQFLQWFFTQCSVARLSQSQVALRYILGCTQERSLLLASSATRYSLGQIALRNTISSIEERGCLPAPSVKQPLLHQMIYRHMTRLTQKRASNNIFDNTGNFTHQCVWEEKGIRDPNKNFLFCVNKYIYIFFFLYS